MQKKTQNLIGWIISGLLAALFLMSIFMKLSQNPAAFEQAAKIGFDATTYTLIGVVELVALILFLIPRTGVVGALLLIAYMGGAIATHLQHQESIIVQVVVESLLWVAAALRFPELTRRLMGTKE